MSSRQITARGCERTARPGSLFDASERYTRALEALIEDACEGDDGGNGRSAGEESDS